MPWLPIDTKMVHAGGPFFCCWRVENVVMLWPSLDVWRLKVVSFMGALLMTYLLGVLPLTPGRGQNPETPVVVSPAMCNPKTDSWTHPFWCWFIQILLCWQGCSENSSRVSSESRILRGELFQSRGPTTVKDWSPSLVWVLGTSHVGRLKSSVASRSDKLPGTVLTTGFAILESLHWFYQRRSQMPHFGAVHTQEGYDPQLQTRPRFLYSAPTPKFHYPMFTRSEIIVLTSKQTHKQTNKQTPLKTSNGFCYSTTLGNDMNQKYTEFQRLECRTLLTALWCLWTAQNAGTGSGFYIPPKWLSFNGLQVNSIFFMFLNAQ